MSYKAVKAIKLGTAATSAGIVHFDPERAKKTGDPRYAGGIFSAADAAVLERKKIGEIVDDADERDYERWQTELRVGRTVNEAAADRIGAAVDEDEEAGLAAVVSNLETVAFQKDTPAREPSLSNTVDPDAAPGANGGAPRAEPSILDGNLTTLRESLENIDDAEELTALRTAEQGGKSRQGALDAIDARLEAVKGSGS